MARQVSGREVPRPGGCGLVLVRRLRVHTRYAAMALRIRMLPTAPAGPTPAGGRRAGGAARTFQASGGVPAVINETMNPRSR